jgi:surfeit locus 1 family protein
MSGGRGSVRRTVTLVTIAAIVATTCVALGLWQLDRLQQKRDLNAAARSGLAEPTLPIDAALPPSARPDALRYHRAIVTGTYDIDGEVILFGRTLDERPGNHVLTPLVLADGSAIIVDRGWVPPELDTPPVSEVAPPPGEVDVEGVLFASEGDVPGQGRGASLPGVDTIARLDLARLQAQLPYPIAPVYLLRQQPSASAASLPRPAPLPELSEGPHLSYAIQWFCFAAIALLGCAVLLRRDRRDGEGPRS